MNKLTNLAAVFEAEKDGKLVLPNFQRGYVWKKEQQRSLIASFIVHLPINSMLVLCGDRGDFAEKRMCWKGVERIDDESEHTECRYLLDGQQRLSTLKNTFTNLFQDTSNWKVQLDALENNLRGRWFLNLSLTVRNTSEEESSETIMDNPFGLREMQFHAEVLETMDPADMEPRLEWIPIAPKDERAWYAPAELKGEHADNFFAETAKRHLVPLYYWVNHKTCGIRIA